MVKPIRVGLDSSELQSYVLVDGYRTAMRELKKCLGKELSKELTAAIRESAERIIIPAIQQETPVRTGRLRGSVKPGVRVSGMSIRAGTPKGIPYAGPIHFGWKKRNIQPNKFIYRGAQKSLPEFVEEVQGILREYEKRCSKRINRR